MKGNYHLILDAENRPQGGTHIQKASPSKNLRERKEQKLVVFVLCRTEEVLGTKGEGGSFKDYHSWQILLLHKHFSA